MSIYFVSVVSFCVALGKDKSCLLLNHAYFSFNLFSKIPSFEGLEERLKMYLEQYNESIRGAGMDLVFFRDAMIHLMRVSGVAKLSLFSSQT